MWSHSFHSESTLAGLRRLRPLRRSAKRSRNGLKSSYSMTNSRPLPFLALCSSIWATICSRRAVLPAPFSPNTIDVAGLDGSPYTLSHCG